MTQIHRQFIVRVIAVIWQIALFHCANTLNHTWHICGTITKQLFSISSVRWLQVCHQTRAGEFRWAVLQWNDSKFCYIAGIFSQQLRLLLAYFEVTWDLTIKLFPAKSLWSGNVTKCMTSEDNNALLPGNVDWRAPLHLNFFNVLVVLYNKSFNDWYRRKLVDFVSLETQCFPGGAEDPRKQS